tara:strand:+ start:637 stop:1020 length:384 start_codon:yes stop_codon:yes gene_type:complete
MTTHNKYAGEIKATLGDKERVFKLTFERLVHLEDATGKSVMELSRAITAQTFKTMDIVEIVYQGLIGAGGKFEKKAIGKMVLDDGLIASAGIASNILASLFLTKDELSPLVEGENQSKTKDTQSKNT